MTHAADVAERSVAAYLAKVTELPLRPRGKPNEPWSDSDEIERYLDLGLQLYINQVRQIQPFAEQFSPEQANQAFNGGLVLQQELDALETALKAVVRERQERGAAPVARSKRADPHTLPAPGHRAPGLTKRAAG